MPTKYRAETITKKQISNKYKNTQNLSVLSDKNNTHFQFCVFCNVCLDKRSSVKHKLQRIVRNYLTRERCLKLGNSAARTKEHM